MPKRKKFCPDTVIQHLAEKVKVAEIAPYAQYQLIQCALKCMESNIRYRTEPLSPVEAWRYLRLQLGQEANEVFAVLFLDNKHRVLAFEKLFYGTVNSTTVHPRVVIQRALFHNAAAVILSHNHPTGSTEPSAADQYITAQLKQLLHIIDVRVLDHIIVSTEGFCSMVERGMID